jgi:dynein light intermediate chain 1
MINAGTTTEPLKSDENIWFKILNSISSSKVTQRKNLLILGDENSGKSTIINEIANRHPTEDNSRIPKYALSYTYIDINEEEDTVAHVGLYRLSGNSTYKSLIPYALTEETIGNSVAIISLSWENPSDFLKSLEKWLDILEDEIKKSISSDLLKELQNKIERSIHEYKDPNNNDSSKMELNIDSSELNEINIPLPEGCLLKNLGIPIIIVCTKCDLIEELENKNKNFNDEKFDYIQQVLRTVCLQYGASLIYVTTKNPSTFDMLDSYLLSLFFNEKNSNLSKSLLKSFEFDEPAQYIDKKSVFIPSGWDSKGRINLLNEEFDGIINRSDYEKIIYSTGYDAPSAMETILTALDDQTFLQNHLEDFQENSIKDTKFILNEKGDTHSITTTSPTRRYSTSRSSSFSISDNKYNINVLNRLKESTASNQSYTPKRKDKLPRTLSETADVDALIRNSSLKSSTMSEALQDSGALKNFFDSLINKKGTTSSNTGSSSPTTQN